MMQVTVCTVMRAGSISDNARGGDDTLIGGAGGENSLYGDATDLSDSSRGGNDTLIGGDNATNYLVGDAGDFMTDNAVGGLIGGGAGSISYAVPAPTICGATPRSLLAAPPFFGVSASPTAPNGNVKTAADTFVFAPSNGYDLIGDFPPER
jgi:Ca2+-binding RTX toxin-like protein